jgi:hypothetical protein
MTTICSFDCNQSALRRIAGDVKTYAPVDGKWVEVSARVFEERVRNLAYGLMVRDYRRDETIAFSGCTDEMKPFIKTACKLAHLNVSFDAEADAPQLTAVDVEYLMLIGGTWSRKYKASVDRTITRILLGC